MSRFVTTAFVIATGLAGAVVAAPPEVSKKVSSRTAAAPAALSVDVQKALEAELRGDNGARQSKLADRLTAAPGDASARWHSGEVRIGEQWIPFDRVADHADRWKEMYDYRKERETRRATVDDQLFLADGSRSHKLFDEERAHLTSVVSLAPGHPEAHARLGDFQTEGRWIPYETARRFFLTLERWQTSVKTHGPAAATFVKSMRRKSANATEEARRFEEWLDPEKIPALEAAVGDAGDSLQQSYVRWLGTFPCYEASQALVRQVLFSDHAEIRVQATAEIRKRPVEDYMRELIASLRMIRSAPKPQSDLGAAAHWAAFSVDSLDQQVDLQLVLRNPIERIRVLQMPGVSGFQDDHREVGMAAAQLWQTNLVMQVAKDETRVERALRLISDVSEAPVNAVDQVWDWWAAENDGNELKNQISMNYDQPWYVDTRRRRVEPTPQQLIRQKTCPPGSCLAAGTLMVTEMGSRAVETIEVGDRVLTQDVETGELTFKPVLATTVRGGAKLMRVKTADNEIVCSQGHPFWVNTGGWIQARALRAGMPLHMVKGTTEVVSVEPAGEGTVHNLVVADSHTYFVGKENAFLSHDVTPRLPTNALTPGLQPIWTTPLPEDEAAVTVK
jgi:hypothetical protein